MKANLDNEQETATLGGGCFWCLEPMFSELKGIIKIESGYSGGITPDPTYEQVCTGKTGHAEVIQMTFNPQVISFSDILKFFFTIHDPTTLNRQGSDVGTQYRSVIFYHTKKQKSAAEKVINELTKKKIYDNPIVTQITRFTSFYKAESYHQNYYKKNPQNPYCNIVISPKLIEVRKKFHEKLK